MGKASVRAKCGLMAVVLVLQFLCMPGFAVLADELQTSQVTLLANGDFEEVANGGPVKWTAYENRVMHESSAEQVHSGAHSVKLVDPSATLGSGLRSNKMTVEPGKRYSASVHAFTVEGVSQAYLEYWDASDKRIDVGIMTSTTRGSWERLGLDRAAPANAAYATLLLYLHGPNVGYAYFDAADFVPVQPPVLSLPENGGFETVVSGMPKAWKSYVSAIMHESSTELVFAGTYSVKLTDPSATAGTGIRSVNMPVKPGETYEASVMSYNLEGASDLYLEFWDTSNKRIDVGTRSNKAIGSWENMTIRRVAPANASYATLLLYQSGPNKGKAYFDEAKFREVVPMSGEYDHLAVNVSKTSYRIGDSGNIGWYGTLSNGGKLDPSEVTKVFFESSNPAVIAIDSASGRFQALSAGSSIIKVKVTAMGVTKTGTVTLRAGDFTGEILSSKTKSNYYTADKIANARRNIDRYDWAKQLKDSAVAKAAPYAALDAETIWSIVTPQSVSRSLGIVDRYTMRTKPSPDPADSTLNNYGNYPWIIDPINHPWKLKSPVTGRLFPTNDFEKFYQSGLNEFGLFDYEQALRNGSSYLVNLENPDSKWGVDDGWGWHDGEGNIWTFIAYYNHWGIWYNGFIMNALNSLRDAYLYTGNPEYAYKGLILLDRVADVYPDLDVTGYPWSKGFDNGDPSVHTAQGKAVNDIWETALAKSLLLAYDAFFPEMESLEGPLTLFLSEKAQTYQMANPKHSIPAIRKNIEDNIVRVVYPSMKNSIIRGNMGMHQSALALAAVVLDEEGTSKMWLDYVFQSGSLIQVKDPDAPYGRQYQVTGGDLSRLLVDEVDRDGMGNEAAPGYNELWLSTFLEAAEYLDGYARYPEYDMYKNVKFQKMFSSFYQLALLGKYTPSIGDSGFLGSPALRGNIEQDRIAFERWGDPLHAQLIYLKSGSSIDNLRGGIFTADPERVVNAIKEVIETKGPLKLDSTIMNGYGLAALRDGEASRATGGISYHFNELPIVSSNRGTKYLPAYDALLFQNLDGPGARITFEFEVEREDEYDIDLLPNKAPSYASYTYAIDGEVVGTYDFYGGTAPKSYSTLATKRLAAGKHTLTFEYAGQPAGSTGYYAAFKRLALFTKAEREQRDKGSIDTQRDLWLYYGRNTGHGHKDTLNLGLHMYGMDLSPDLGYPDVTGNDPKRIEWTSNTIAHNTVVVNESKQANSVVGLPHHYDGDGHVQLIDVEAPHVYPEAEVYRRTTSLIRVDDVYSYAVDFYRVEGGSSHHYSFHSADAEVAAEGLQLISQKDASGQYVGTYAGADVPYGQKEPGSGTGSGYKGSGFHYLQNVDRAAGPQAPFSIDWKVKDTWGIHEQDPNVHLRLTMLNAVNEVALADGQPPQNNAKSPEAVRYMIAARTGEHLKSTFTSVLEPYQQERLIDSIELAAVKAGGAAVTDEAVRAVKVTLKNGRTDYIVYSLHSDTLYTIDDRIEFRGFFGVYSEQDGRMVYAYVQDGTRIGAVGALIVGDAVAGLEGTVVDFTRELSTRNEIVVRVDLRGVEPGSLVGRMIVVQTDGVRNGAYLIRAIESAGSGLYRLDIGDAVLIRSYVDANDFSKGYKYDIAGGAPFVIPLSTEAAIPYTRAAVSGSMSGSWYNGDATVTMQVYSDLSMLQRTEFSLDGGESWSVYEQPVVLSNSGEHTLQYRSVSTTGHAEPVQSVRVRVDKLAPTLDVRANGGPLVSGAAFSDAQTVTISVYASDAHSGVAWSRLAVDGVVYANGAVHDFAGKPGEHRIVVEASDEAGNVVESVYTFRIVATVEGMLQLIDRYAAAGDITGPMVPQLRNSLEQVKHQLGKGDRTQAAKHMNDLLRHLDNTALEEHVTAGVKEILAADADFLINEWK